jgi:hypothetical protein
MVDKIGKLVVDCQRVAATKLQETLRKNRSQFCEPPTEARQRRALPDFGIVGELDYSRC